MTDNAQRASAGSESYFSNIKIPLDEALYCLAPSDAGADWSKYQIGCDRCNWWRFEGSRWRAFYALYKHRCRGTS